jgi:transposase InsO family protein
LTSASTSAVSCGPPSDAPACWDAVAESFWASLKRECIQGRVFATRAEARRAIFRWINWYNTTRQHTSLDGARPTEWEQQDLQAS